MTAQPSYFPLDWLAARSEHASDLDLAVLLVNSLDLVADPADRLVDLRWLRAAFGQVGHDLVASELGDDDLPRLRDLRTALRAAFEAATEADAARALTPAPPAAGAIVQLLPDDGGAGGYRLGVGSGRTGIEALEARLPAAVAAHLAAHGPSTLGVCASDPCRCAFVDRTRAKTRRYCCGYCNDRAAARAYRRRRRG